MQEDTQMTLERTARVTILVISQKRNSVHLRCYQPKVAISDDGTVVIEIFAIVTGSVSALILVPMNDHHFLVLGIACDSIARSLDLWVAILRRGRRIVYHHIVNEPVFKAKSETRRSFKRETKKLKKQELIQLMITGTVSGKSMFVCTRESDYTTGIVDRLELPGNISRLRNTRIPLTNSQLLPSNHSC